jgi:hypothetical protein
MAAAGPSSLPPVSRTVACSPHPGLCRCLHHLGPETIAELHIFLWSCRESNRSFYQEEYPLNCGFITFRSHSARARYLRFRSRVLTPSRLHVHGARLVRTRRIRHFMSTTGGPVPQEPQKAADEQPRGGDQRRPHQYLSNPHAPLHLDDPLLCVPKPGHLVHEFPNARGRVGENALHPGASWRGPVSLPS